MISSKDDARAMTIVLNVFYSGVDGAARMFADRVSAEGVLAQVREEDGNLMYSYYTSVERPDEVLLVERWRDAESLDRHGDGAPLKRIREIASELGLETRVYRYSQS